jgi:putative flippase GtrA
MATLRLRHVVRFAATSGVTTLVSTGLLLLLYGQHLINSEVVSTASSHLLVAPLAYYLNRHWVWSKTGPSHLRREILPFYVLTVAGLLASLGAASGVHALVHSQHLSHDVATAVLEGANLGAYAVVWVVKLIILNRVFASPSPPAQESPDTTNLSLRQQ